jgi:putative MATE family efflux protein
MSTVVRSARFGSFATALRLLREGLRGSTRDFTEGHVGHAVIVLSIPMVLEMCMESLFAVVDVFFVSKLGADAVAAVGLTEGMLTIVYSVAMGLVIGATAVVSRRIGEKDPDAAAVAAVQVIGLGLLLSVAIGILGWLFARPLLALMGAEAGVLAEPAGYATVMLTGCGSVVMLFLNNAIFRAAGDATVAMRVLWFANGINIVLDPMLIFGFGPIPAMGVAGAAVATTIGRSTAVLVQFWLLVRGAGRIQVRWRHVRVAPGVMWSVCRISATGLLQILVDTTSWVVLVRVISTFGSPAVAGYTIGIRTVLFAILPAWGLSNAAATMVGQALGAGKPERGEEAVWTACRYNLWFLGAIGMVFVVLAPQIVAIYTADPAIVPGAIACLRIVSLGFPLFAFGMVLTQAFNGAGDAWTPTWINVACFWAWQMPLAYALALGWGMGPSGVYWAVMIAFSTLAVVSAVIFRRGRWKAQRI